jgi:hypothetical protein
MADVLFFYDFPSELAPHLDLLSTMMLGTVSVAAHGWVTAVPKRRYRFARADVFSHLSSFTTEAQSLWVCSQLQYQQRLVPYEPFGDPTRRKRRLNEGASSNRMAAFVESVGRFTRRQCQIYLFNIAVKYDSVAFLRMIAKEVHTQPRHAVHIHDGRIYTR